MATEPPTAPVVTETATDVRWLIDMAKHTAQALLEERHRLVHALAPGWRLLPELPEPGECVLVSSYGAADVMFGSFNGYADDPKWTYFGNHTYETRDAPFAWFYIPPAPVPPRGPA